MVDAFVGVDGAVADLAFDGHDALVVEADDYVAPGGSEFAFATELPRCWGLVGKRDVAGRHFLEAEGG